MKKKKCSWWQGHCLHKIDGTERKHKRPRSKRYCNKSDEYVYERFWGSCIDITVQGKCCWCDTIKTMEMSDFDITRANNYPDAER